MPTPDAANLFRGDVRVTLSYLEIVTRNDLAGQGNAIMKLVLIRHAMAVPEGATLRDAHRFLSLEGRAQAATLGRAVAQRGVEVTRVITSPRTRAVQTAEIVVAALGQVILVEADALLAPSASPEKWLRAIEVQDAGGVTLVVGHEPHLSACASLLVGREQAPLPRASACAIEDGVLTWSFSPSHSA